MAEKLRIVVDEIQTTIKQTFDDKVVSRAQVAYWVIIVGNKLLGQHNAKRDSGAFLNVYIVPVKVATTTQLPNLIKGRKYIELPGAIFDIDKDGGVEFMAYYDSSECKPDYRRKTIHRSTPSKAQWFELNDKTAPSPESPFFERRGDIFQILGIEAVPVKEIEVGIYQTISSLEKIDLDADFFFPQELLSQLKMEVTNLARYSFLFPADRENSGSDESNENKITPVQKIMSVNQQSDQTQ